MWVLLGAYDSEEPDHANHYDYRSRYREVGFFKSMALVRMAMLLFAVN